MIKERRELLTFGMGKLFVKLAIPSMFGFAIVGLYNLADVFFVGQYVGKEAVGAVALIFAAVLFNQGILTLIGAGSASFLSIAIGKNDKSSINKLLGNMIVSVIVLSGLFSIITFLFTDQIVTFFGGVGLIHDLGVDYLKILLIGFIPAALGPAMNFLVRGEGKIKQAMVIMIIAGLLNIILDWILIGIYGMGVEGAAIATVVSQIFYVILQFGYFRWGNSVIKLKEMTWKIEKAVLSKVLKVGFSMFMMSIMGVVQQIILFRILQFYGGNDHISLMGATYRVFMFSFLLIWGLGAGLQPVVGVNFGAKQYSRVKKGFNKFTKITFLLSFSLWLFFMLFPSQILNLFIQDVSLVADNVHLFRIFTSLFFGYAFFATIINFFIGIGNVKEAGILTISRQIAFFIPLVFILPLFFGVTGVWLSMPLADGLTLILALYFKSKLFKKELNKKDVPLEIDKKSLETI